MKTYRIAAMVAHSGKHLETEVAAYTMGDAIMIFHGWLLNRGIAFDALCELDVSEVVQ